MLVSLESNVIAPNELSVDYSLVENIPLDVSYCKIAPM